MYQEHHPNFLGQVGYQTSISSPVSAKNTYLNMTVGMIMSQYSLDSQAAAPIIAITRMSFRRVIEDSLKTYFIISYAALLTIIFIIDYSG